MFSGGKYKRHEVRGARRKLKWVYIAEQRGAAHHWPKKPQTPLRARGLHPGRGKRFAGGSKTPPPRSRSVPFSRIASVLAYLRGAVEMGMTFVRMDASGITDARLSAMFDRAHPDRSTVAVQVAEAC